MFGNLKRGQDHLGIFAFRDSKTYFSNVVLRYGKGFGNGLIAVSKAKIYKELRRSLSRSGARLATFTLNISDRIHLYPAIKI